MPSNNVLYVLYASGALLLSLLAAGHALLHKRDPRAQVLWVVTTFTVPVLGPLLYWVFGVNRIETRARKWQQRGFFRQASVRDLPAALLQSHHPSLAEGLISLSQIGERVTGRPLVGGNDVRPLYNGDQAYPAMLNAIRDAKRYVFLASYLFEGDGAGQDFAKALVEAGARGVDVRVLVDAIGIRVGTRSVVRLLRKKPGVRFERFLPATLSWRALRLNLRNHRKILVVDGILGFTGGLNIGGRNVLATAREGHQTLDLHFALRGPIVSSLEETFCEDWAFSRGEIEAPEPIEPETTEGTALCRGVKDGPNEDFERLQWLLSGALSCARKNVKIVTPYFIPSRELVSALHTAVLRGVQVEIVLPEWSNQRLVDWACRAHLSEVIAHGVRVYHRGEPFAHTKLLMVDDIYVNMGSANLDPRSLRLNFEFNVEIYDLALAKELSEYFEHLKDESNVVTLQTLESRGLPTKLWHAMAKTLSPFL